jgi:hypothetical protein
MSEEFNLITFHELVKSLNTYLTSHEGEERINEVVYFDLAKWKSCTFKNCRLIVEYGWLTATECTFINCRAEALPGSPAAAILKLDKLFRGEYKTEIDTKGSDLEEWK